MECPPKQLADINSFIRNLCHRYFCVPYFLNEQAEAQEGGVISSMTIVIGGHQSHVYAPTMVTTVT